MQGDKRRTFSFDVSLSDSLKKVSSGFKDFVIDEKDGFMILIVLLNMLVLKMVV